MVSVEQSIASDGDLLTVGSAMDTWEPQDIVAWAQRTYSPSLTLACSFGGITGMALLDMAVRLAAACDVYYLDTGFLFAETYDLIERVERTYGITPRAIRPAWSADEQARQEGESLWSRNPDRCCAIRKVEPQRAALAGYAAWMTGLRRVQSDTRHATPLVQWDTTFDLVKIAPLAHWDDKQVWRYIAAHHVPYNALHDAGYPSIGCTHCTRSVQKGEDARAGRWSGFAKTECGLHVNVGGTR